MGSDPRPYTANEMMHVASARLLAGERLCFVGFGPPAIAVNMAQSTRSFVETIDFTTSPGHLEGERPSGWGAGPTSVVTQLGVYGFDEASGEMELRSLHPGVTLDEVRSATGWDLRTAEDVAQTPAPSDVELRLIREELDPEGAYSR